MQHPIPGFAKPSTGGQVSTPDEANEQATPTCVENLEKEGNEGPAQVDHLDTSDLLGNRLA